MLNTDFSIVSINRLVPSVVSRKCSIKVFVNSLVLNSSITTYKSGK